MFNVSRSRSNVSYSIKHAKSINESICLGILIKSVVRWLHRFITMADFYLYYRNLYSVFYIICGGLLHSYFFYTRSQRSSIFQMILWSFIAHHNGKQVHSNINRKRKTENMTVFCCNITVWTRIAALITSRKLLRPESNLTHTCITVLIMNYTKWSLSSLCIEYECIWSDSLGISSFSNIRTGNIIAFTLPWILSANLNKVRKSKENTLSFSYCKYIIMKI